MKLKLLNENTALVIGGLVLVVAGFFEFYFSHKAIYAVSIIFGSGVVIAARYNANKRKRRSSG